MIQKLGRPDESSDTDTLVFSGVFVSAAFIAYIRIQSTLLGYKIGELKGQESQLLQEQSQLKMELATLTSERVCFALPARLILNRND